jgi:hypothetical protein
MAGDRHTAAEQLELITDSNERARREAENGVRQYAFALDIIRTHVHDPERPFGSGRVSSSGCTRRC